MFEVAIGCGYGFKVLHHGDTFVPRLVRSKRLDPLPTYWFCVNDASFTNKATIHIAALIEICQAKGGLAVGLSNSCQQVDLERVPRRHSADAVKSRTTKGHYTRPLLSKPFRGRIEKVAIAGKCNVKSHWLASGFVSWANVSDQATASGKRR